MPNPQDTILRLQAENNRLQSELSALRQILASDLNHLKSSADVFDKDSLRSILEALPVATTWANADGIIEFTNYKFIELFGYNITDIPTVEDWFNTAYPDPAYRDRIVPRWLNSMETVRQQGGEVESIEANVTCKDGRVRHVVAKTALIADRVLVIFDDLTEPEEIQRALLESQLRFQSIFNSVNDGIAVADSETGNFIMANTSFMAMLGYTEDEILSLGVADIHPRSALEKVFDYFERLARDEEIFIAPDLPVQRKNGDVFYVDISSGVMTFNNRKCLIGIFRDISERKKYEEAILQERDFSDAALNSLPGIFYMFDQDGRFLRWNKNFETVSQYSSEEMEQTSPLDFFEGEDKKHIQERIRETFEKGESDAEAGFISKDGTRRPYYFSGLLAHIGGKPCLIGMGLDISRRKQAEKMQALGQLAGGIAHDFNNHLSAIMGFAEILVEQVEEDGLRSYAEMIALAATRSADLTRQLLAFARKGKYMAEPVDVHSIIAEVVTFLGRSIDKRITIKQVLSADPPSILGDASQIQNALLNLAINSRDAMPGGGELTFSTSSESLDETRCKGLNLDIIPGRYIKISITDTGKGIDQNNLPHLFEPFFTTKEVGEGTGMGLAAVYGTVRSHKGGITVSSRPGQGSTFDIYFPVNEETDNTITTPALTSETTSNTGRILVVDDEKLILELAGSILKARGHEAILCADGYTAIDLYQKESEQIDLVILDMMMPNINGVETFAALRAINPSARILLSSGYSKDGQAQSLLDAGAVDFIQKPFTISQLTQKVSQALNHPVT